MSLKSLLALVDDKLHDVFHKPVFDPVKSRKPFLSGLKKARAQFESNKRPRGANKWFDISNSVVEFSPSLNGKPVKIGGKDKLYVPSERFPDVLTHAEAACNAGELDDQFMSDHGVNGLKSSRAGKASPLAGRGWSEARRAAHEAAKAAAAKPAAAKSAKKAGK
jgi:hypothetical protein